MSRTKSVSVGVAGHFAKIEDERRQQLAEANARYWTAVRQGADGDGATAAEVAAVADAMQLLGHSLETFNAHVQALRDVRSLRDEGNRERAEEKRDELRRNIEEGNRRLLLTKKQAADLQEEIGNLAGAYHAVMDRANAQRSQAAAIALALQQQGAGAVIAELAVPPITGRLGRVRALRECFAGNALRMAGDVFEMICRPHDLENPHFELLAWLDEQEPEG